MIKDRRQGQCVFLTRRRGRAAVAHAEAGQRSVRSGNLWNHRRTSKAKKSGNEELPRLLPSNKDVLAAENDSRGVSKGVCFTYVPSN